MYRIIIIIFLFTLFFFSCKNNKNRISINNDSIKSNIIETSMGNERITPELFFKITIEINEITKKYKKLIGEDENKYEKLNTQMENEINNVYAKYNLTEEDINRFSENNYRDLESYLVHHPEMEKKLHSE